MSLGISSKAIGISFILFIATHLTGCVSLDANPDPFEPINRQVFAFNKLADKIVLKPAAMAYHGMVPKFARQGLDNFFNNATDTSVIANDLLQLQFPKLARDTGRLLVNTTIGLGGFIDIASGWGWQRVPTTFGDTLTRYGWKRSPYLVLPIWGPSTVRDAIGSFVDFYATPWGYIEPEKVRIGLATWYTVNARANLLDMEGLIEVATFDEYVLLRDVYFQRREARLTGEATAEDFAI